MKYKVHLFENNMKSIFQSWWFSLSVVIVGLIMFIRYLIPAIRLDMILAYAGELLIWLAITITFFIRFIIQIKKTRRPKL